MFADDCADTQEVPILGNTASEPAPPVPVPKVGGITPASRRRGGSLGGRRARQNVLLIGIEGLPDRIDLRTSQTRMAILEALATAIARGKTSALAATTLVQIIKESRAESESHWERVANQLAAKLDALPARRA